MATGKQIKEAPSSISHDSVRSLFNQNFRLLSDFMKKVENGEIKIFQEVDTPNIGNIVFPDSPIENSRYELVYKNGQWIVEPFKGTQVLFENNETLHVGSKHQYITSGAVTLEPGSNSIVEPGGELVIIPEP